MNPQIAVLVNLPVNSKKQQQVSYFRRFNYIYNSKDGSLFKVIENFNLEITPHEEFSEVMIYWNNSTYGYVDNISVSVTDFENRAKYFYNLINKAEGNF